MFDPSTATSFGDLSNLSLNRPTDISLGRSIHPTGLDAELGRSAGFEPGSSAPQSSPSVLDPLEPRRSLWVVDSAIAAPEQLLADLPADAQVLEIAPHEDGIDRITGELLTQQHTGAAPIAAIHILSHGNTGQVQLGNTTLTVETVRDRADDLAQWQAALSDDADILLYGCNVAADGGQLVKQLADLTGADLAASDDLTGNLTLGGDGDLEVLTGEVVRSSILSGDRLAAYTHVLATYAVTTTAADEDDGALGLGTGDSLYEVITYAPIADDDTIRIDAPGTHTLGNFGPLLINVNNLTIEGNGASLDAGGVAFFPALSHNGNGTLTISNFSILNRTNDFLDGGAISSNGQIILNNSTIANNTVIVATGDGGGIFATGDITLNNSQIINNSAANDGSGGGLFSQTGNIMINDSIISGNEATSMSAIGGGGGGANAPNMATGTITVINSTIANNKSVVNGGGLQSANEINLTASTVSNNQGEIGGGIYTTGAVEMIGSTLSGNRATKNGGGLAAAGGTITGSTITNNLANSNGGGLAAINTATFTLRNTLISGNRAVGVGGDVFGDDDTFTGDANNLIGDLTGISAGTLGTGSDLVVFNPLLDTLKNNGGLTQTHALLPGSPAIDAGNNNVTFGTTDQRGGPRILDGNGDGIAAIDIGSYEADGLFAKDIEVRDFANQQVIPDGSIAGVDFGRTALGRPLERTFQITNLAGSSLAGGATKLELLGLDLPTGFSVISGFSRTSLAPGESALFTLSFDGGLPPGFYAGDLLINNSDPDENPYNFPIRAEILDFPTITCGPPVPPSRNYTVDSKIQVNTFTAPFRNRPPWLQGSSLRDLRLGDSVENIPGVALPVIWGFGGDDTLEGTSGRDRIKGGNNDDLILGLDEADRLSGGSGADLIVGGLGGDRLEGDAGDDTLWGEEDADDLFGDEGNDLLIGGSGHDRLLGYNGDDDLIGGDGDDLLDGGAGSDRLQGCGGNDQFVLNLETNTSAELIDQIVDFDPDSDWLVLPSQFTVDDVDSTIDDVTLYTTVLVRATQQPLAIIRKPVDLTRFNYRQRA